MAPGALLGSPFNVKWRFSAPAGDVEESKLCLFSVIMPAKCVSSVSPRFHYRRVAFCFLPLAAILEFSVFSFLILVFELRAYTLKHSTSHFCEGYFHDRVSQTIFFEPHFSYSLCPE
jgi:hypothetical protein